MVRVGLLTCASTSGGAFPTGQPAFFATNAVSGLRFRLRQRSQRRGPSVNSTRFPGEIPPLHPHPYSNELYILIYGK